MIAYNCHMNVSILFMKKLFDWTKACFYEIYSMKSNIL